MTTSYRDDATFYRSALLLGLIKGEAVVAWSDDVIARDPGAPHAFVDIASTDPADLTALREAIYPLCDSKEAASAGVIHRILGCVSRDLASGRRGFDDTMTVLSQVRKFLRVGDAMNETLKSLAVDVWQARHNLGGTMDVAEQRVRDWLHGFD